MVHRRTTAIAGLLLLILCACAPATTQQQTSSGTPNIPSALRAAALRVEDAGPIEQSFFSVPAHVWTVEGGDLQIYTYASDAAAAADAAKVQPNGAIDTSMPMWIAPPHFYRSGPTLAIYLGSNQRVLAELERLLGPQFAGQ